MMRRVAGSAGHIPFGMLRHNSVLMTLPASCTNLIRSGTAIAEDGSSFSARFEMLFTCSVATFARLEIIVRSSADCSPFRSVAFCTRIFAHCFGQLGSTTSEYREQE
jgi:hypothetical protein